MLIKKFIGRDLDELINSVDSELGPDALILMTRTIERGVYFSFNSQPEIEITAGVEPVLLKKYNPYHEALEGGSAPSSTLASSNGAINCTGPILPDSEGVTLLALAGSNGQAVIDSCIKLMHYFRNETPHRVGLLCIRQIFENVSTEFQEAAQQNQIPYDVVLDRFAISESMTKYKDYDFLVAGFPGGMHPTDIKGYLEGATPVWIELVVANGEDAFAYKKLYPQGLILNNLEAEADAERLPEIIAATGIPLSFIAHQGKLMVAQPEQVETLISNSKWKT